ncbi:unnamed protein product [Rotaria sp. Silwood1]|nr:unnamed protein product [Rotaria sp. Silwood1]
MPIKQFFYFDAIECLPENVFQFSATTVNIDRNQLAEWKSNLFSQQLNKVSRYYSQEIIFGQDFQHQLSTLKCFLVGAGAIGCEVLKNFWMMGIGCEKEGVIYVSDMDMIEKSNLNRHFLFRPWNIGQMKSNTVAKVMSTWKSSVNIHAFVDRVDSETEHIFDDKFFERLDCVIDAVDNIPTHKYLDYRCVYYRKPLIVSEASGVKSNVQVVVPRISEVYERLTNKKVADHVRSLILEIGCDDLQGNEIEDVPYVNYIFR